MNFEDIKKKWKVKSVDKDSKDFPALLKELGDCPKKLYYRGEWDKEIFDRTAAIVGSRKMTKYGKDVTESLSAYLTARQTTIISGFMYGIDTQAHKMCLYYGGRTITVLGGGLDYLYPKDNLNLYREILENKGLIISEYENNVIPSLWTFPQRNRIVSGLTNRGVYVIEAGLKSGSLITANLAIKQGKELWAAPGQITSESSMGTNWLINEKKAKMLYSLEENNHDNKKQLALPFELSKDEVSIMTELKNEGMNIDELAKKMNYQVAKVTALLSQLDLKGAVVEESGKFWAAGGGAKR